jgi:protein tyrosine phosphatase (PTP) superfamily phosphohydrolase (DUF442 family)
MMDFSQITENLFVGTTPQPENYAILHELGVLLVINMRFERPPYRDPHNPPIPALWIPSIDSPLVPISLRSLQRGTQAALETIRRGGKVYVHCAGGRHRGVAMGAAILIAQGYSPKEAMHLIKDRREAADPDIWYIRRRIIRFAQAWDHHAGSA